MPTTRQYWLGGCCFCVIVAFAVVTNNHSLQLIAAAADTYSRQNFAAQIPRTRSSLPSVNNSVLLEAGSNKTQNNDITQNFTKVSPQQAGDYRQILPQECSKLCKWKNDPEYHQYFSLGDDIRSLTSVVSKHAYMTLADIATHFELPQAPILSANNSRDIIHSCLSKDRILVVYFTTAFPRGKQIRLDLAFLQNLTIPHIVLTSGPGHLFYDPIDAQAINNPYLLRWYGPSQVHGPGDRNDESMFHERAYPIPLGVTTKYDRIEQLTYITQRLNRTIRLDEKDKLVLVNFSPVGSGKTPYRSPPYNRFCNESHASFSNEFNQTCTTGGFFDRHAWPRNQRRAMWAAGANDTYDYWSQHKYTVSPRGQQADCHRFWEALYMKSVPIVLSSEVYYQNLVEDYFAAYNTTTVQELPILFVDSWNEVTKELLDTEWDYRFRRILQDPWPPPYLTLEHTKHVIEAGVKEEVSKRAQENPTMWGALQQELSSGRKATGLWENRKRCYLQS